MYALYPWALLTGSNFTGGAVDMTRRLMLPLFLLALSGAAFGDADDPPARVARLNYMSGSVSFRPGTVEDWAEATLNYPMTTGDHLWSDENSSAEMHVGST